MKTQTGFLLDTPYGLDDLERADTVVVPGWSDPAQPPSDPLCGALQAAHARGARVVSLCTGAFVLAHAGLLDGRRATTHWRYADELRRRYPSVEVDPNPLYVSDGSIHTSAGTAAGIDLCLTLVAADHGIEVAAAVSRRLVMPLHRPGGQAQYIDAPIEPPAAELLEWARERLGDGIRVDDLATHASLSTRTLSHRANGWRVSASGSRNDSWSRRRTRWPWWRAAPATRRRRRCARSSRPAWAPLRSPTGTRSAADDDGLAARELHGEAPLRRAGGDERAAHAALVERDPGASQRLLGALEEARRTGRRTHPEPLSVEASGVLGLDPEHMTAGPQRERAATVPAAFEPL